MLYSAGATGGGGGRGAPHMGEGRGGAGVGRVAFVGQRGPTTGSGGSFAGTCQWSGTNIDIGGVNVDHSSADRGSHRYLKLEKGI